MKRILTSLILSFSLCAPIFAQAGQKQEPGKPQAKSDPATLKDYAGRYELDPSVFENFIVDIIVENGELWAKPSHESKHKLVAAGKEEFAHPQVEGIKFKFIRDEKGAITSLVMTQSGQSVNARKLALPPPSLTGNVTFRLKGYTDARIVAVAGTFNNWNQTSILFAKEGDEWVCRVEMAPGKYTYKFIIDGNWITDPANPFEEDDGLGNMNSVLVVKAK